MKKVVFSMLLIIVGLLAHLHLRAGTAMMVAQDTVKKDNAEKYKKIMTELNKIQKALIKISGQLDTTTSESNNIIESQLGIIAGSRFILNKIHDNINDPQTKEELAAYSLYTQEFINREKDGPPLSVNEPIPYELDDVLRQNIYTYGEQTRNLKFFVEAQSPKVDTLLQSVYDTVKKTSRDVSVLPTKTDLNNAKTSILEDNTIIKNNVKKIDDKATIIRDTADYIKNILGPIPSSKFVLGVAAYSNNIYGATFFVRVKKGMDHGSETDITQYIGAEVVFPVNATVAGNSFAGQSSSTNRNADTVTITTTDGGVTTGTATVTTTTTTTTQLHQTSVKLKDPGGFILYAVRDRKLLMYAGMGYFNGGKSQNISWTGGALYFPKKLGMGLCYSPLTGTGVQLCFRF